MGMRDDPRGKSRVRETGAQREREQARGRLDACQRGGPTKITTKPSSRENTTHKKKRKKRKKDNTRRIINKNELLVCK